MTPEHHDVVVVGGGQAGLAASWWLTQRRIEHVVLEQHRVGHEWATRRWESFCLVTPNWHCALPGFAYQGKDPAGFMVRDEVVGFLGAYAMSFGPPLREGVTVERLSSGDRFALSTSDGELSADQVLLATGGYHAPALPRLADRLPEDVLSLHSSGYRGPDALPAGAVLVVGTGQSGAQIAEDLHRAGRRVHLATGSAPRVARRHRGRDVMDWLARMGHYDKPVGEHTLGERVRAQANHYVTGRDGGHDIDLRVFAAEGMRLYGHLTGISHGVLAVAADLAANLDRADEVYIGINGAIDSWISTSGADAGPVEAPYEPPWRPGVLATSLDLAGEGITSVVWATGFRRDDRWVELPAFTGAGYPQHVRGVTSVPGLSVLGLPWLHTWGSGRFLGLARDAEHLVDHVVRTAEGRSLSRVG